MDAVAAYRVLSGRDPDARDYIARFSGSDENRHPAPAAAPELTLADAIGRGLRAETAALTERALTTMSELDVVNKLLIPALDRVGEG